MVVVGGVGIAAFLGLENVVCSLILLSADGDGKLVSLLTLTELSLQTERALLNPDELDVLFPSPFSLYW